MTLSRPEKEAAPGAQREQHASCEVIDAHSLFLVEFNETEDPDMLNPQRVVRYVFVEPA